MSKTYEVGFEKTAVFSIHAVWDYLIWHSECRHATDPESVATERVEGLLSEIEDRLSTSPLSSPVSTLLMGIGITDYREFLINPYRVLFKVHANHQVSVYVVAHQRQDLEHLLIDYCLLSV